MNQFDFLNSIQPIEETAKPKAARTGNFKSPEGADLRVCRNGAVFPSKSLVETCREMAQQSSAYWCCS